MDKLLRPETFSADPSAANSSKEWEHWKARFEKFIGSITSISEANKQDLLVNYVSTEIYAHISETADYTASIAALESVFNPKRNVIFARHLLNTCKQDSNTVDAYYQKLKFLAKDCVFGAVNDATHQSEAIREAFIAGLQSPDIRQRLLESEKTALSEIYTLARGLEAAKVQAQSYVNQSSSLNAIVNNNESVSDSEGCANHDDNFVAAAPFQFSCYFCGGPKPHTNRQACPAFNSNCNGCGIQGHFQKVCKAGRQSQVRGGSARGKNRRNNQYRSSQNMTSSAVPHNSSQSQNGTSSALHNHYLAASPPCLSKSITRVLVNGRELDALVDSGSSATFLSNASVRKHQWDINRGDHAPVSMASSSHISHPVGHCTVDVHFNGELLPNQTIVVMKDLCADMIIGLDILSDYKSVTLEFGGHKPPTIVSAAACLIKTPKLFGQLEGDSHPISIKSRRYSNIDKTFIRVEVKKLLEAGIIKECESPWRAQVLVHQGNENHKKRLVIDYSQTINRFTKLDAYPVPRIDEMVEDISKRKYYSTLDLSSAYHQVPIAEDEQEYTAFEADGKLYCFMFIPFGVTNGVSAFQRTVNDIIAAEHLSGVYVYVDNITIVGMTKGEHDKNLAEFLTAAAKYNLEFNDSKTVSGVTSIKLLGYLVSHNSIKPDPDRIQPLLGMPAPNNDKSLKSVLGLFAHYSRWVKNFSDKIHPLSHVTSFPLNDKQIKAFQLLKSEIAKAVLATPDPNLPFTLETDASDYAIGATLCQSTRPIAFFSRTLNSSERNHHSVEKEAYAIVEAIRKWKHYLLGSPFTVITDQQSVSFMFGLLNHGKIKNDKITRWRIELSPYAFDIMHRPGKDNLPADALSRLVYPHCSATTSLKALHDQLCHPGVTRMSHFVRSRNLPFSVEDIKKMTRSCRDCAEVKPRYFKPQQPQHLIKATAPFERLNLDFKGPLPTNTKNKFILTIVDEYSRYPFAFPCTDTSTDSVKSCLTSIFGVFGMPSFIHSDQGSGFMSAELKKWLLEKGIATSRSSRFNPQGNGQVEKYNGTVWKAVQLALRTRKLPLKLWEQVITDVLHSIRSLLCTATNDTPHERVFNFPRKSTTGSSLPGWLTDNSKALMKRHTNRSKYDPLVEEVELLDVNPNTSHVRTGEGVELTVSNKHLAPIGDDSLPNAYDNIVTSDVHDSIVPSDNVINENESNNETVTKTIDNPIRLRRSGRDRTPTVLYPLPDKTSSNSGYQ